MLIIKPSKTITPALELGEEIQIDVDVTDELGSNTINAVDYNIGTSFTVDGDSFAMTAGVAALSHLAFGTNTCELADYTHQEIVDLAVKIFIEEVRYKLLPNERAQRVAQAQVR